MSNTKRRFPSPAEERALKRGCDELVSRLEWELRERPCALRNVRAEYRRICLKFYRQLERTWKSR